MFWSQTRVTNGSDNRPQIVSFSFCLQLSDIGGSRVCDNLTSANDEV